MRTSFAGQLVKRNLFKKTTGIQQRKRKNIISTIVPPKCAVHSSVVVFDIDDTICTDFPDHKTCVKHYFKLASYDSYPPQGSFTISHFEHLLKYLLSKNVRIAIFSAGVDYRNLPLIKEICTNFLGETTYQSLISEGQFQVFSRHHQQDYSTMKDLRIVLKPTEQLENCVLVDDSRRCRNPGQEKNFILVPGIIGFENFGYYYLGLFKSYFESESCNVKPISHFMYEHIKMVSIGYLQYQTTEPSIQFILDMVKIGLNEVRKTEPDAEFYNYDKFIDRVVDRADDCGHAIIDKYTKLPIVVDEPFCRMNSAIEIKDALKRFHAEHLIK